MKISDLRKKLIFTGVYIAIVAVWFLSDWAGCIFQVAFGIPCPGCGMTRAILAAVRLDFCAAFSFHPMFWSIPVLYLYFLADNGLFRNKVDKFVLWGIGAGFFAWWIWKIALLLR